MNDLAGPASAPPPASSGRSGYALGAGLLVTATVLAKACGFLREILVASQHGASVRTDAFYAAQTLPSVLAAALGAGLGTALVPIAAAIRSRKESTAGLYKAFLMDATTASAALGLLILAASPALATLLMPSLQGASRLEAVATLRWMGALATSVSLQYALCGIFHAERKFLIPALAALLDSVGVVGALLISRISGWPINLAAAWTAGSALASLFLLAVALPRTDRRAPSRRAGVVSASGPIMLATLFASAHLAVDRLGGAYLSEGSAAALAYAYILASMPALVLGAPLASAALPYLSALATSGTPASLEKVVMPACRVVCVVFLPVTLFSAFHAGSLVRLVYARGAFNAEDVALTSRALQGYSFSILPLALMLLFSRALYANGRNGAVAAALAAGAGAKILLSILLMRPLTEFGLALSTSAGSAITAGLLAGMLRPSGLRSSVRPLLVAALATAAVLALLEGVHARLVPIPFVGRGLLFVVLCGSLLFGVYGRRRPGRAVAPVEGGDGP